MIGEHMVARPCNNLRSTGASSGFLVFLFVLCLYHAAIYVYRRNEMKGTWRLKRRISTMKLVSDVPPA